jgi:small subunit ribosomal protein S9
LAEDKTYYGTGHRKTAIARVWLKPGEGHLYVNGRDGRDYFAQEKLFRVVMQPLTLTGHEGQFDVVVHATGGGPVAQAEAVRHGMARALLEFNEELRLPLKHAGYLTRDPRAKERKKWGHKRARRGFQFTKR